ncbi:MAG: AgmX/PglI C-terminal domain-containing protein [Myxococcales bacterium]|nr:AgmX/PglI C-terminal domain-containing protein [Myxococcales bacterium]
MFAPHENGRRYVAAAATAAAGLALLWAGAGGEPGSSPARAARATLLGPVTTEPDLEVQLLVHGSLPAAVSAVAPGPAAPAADTAWAGTERSSGPRSDLAGRADPPEPMVGAVGDRPQPPAVRPERPDLRAGRLRKGRTPALREREPPAGRISDRTLRSILGRRQGALEACYHGARALDPTLEGEVTFALTVRQEGTVEVELLDRSPALDQAGVTACIRRKLQALDFTATPPQGGDLHLRVPLSFLRVPEPVADSDA